MQTFKLTQWAVTIDSNTVAMFTPPTCTNEEAIAIAVETYGKNVSGLVNEGNVRRDITNAQLHIADNFWCPECGEYTWDSGKSGHDEKCQRGAEVAAK